MTAQTKITIKDEALRAAAAEGMDTFIQLFVDRMADAVGGELNAEALACLNASQITLWGYVILRNELMDGGCVQLIHNGYGDFFFRNPFARAMRQWGVSELATFINRAKRLCARYGAELTRECSDEEFMALFERFPAFDELDDYFVEHEEEFTEAVARYVDDHVEEFAVVEA